MTAFSDAARPASDAALAFSYAIRAHDSEAEPVGYNARPFTEALRAAMPRMIDGIMTGTTQSENIAPSEPLTLDTLRAARARLLDGPVSDADEIIFTRAAATVDASALVDIVESVNPADSMAVVRFNHPRPFAESPWSKYPPADRIAPTPTPEPKKLPVRKIIFDGDIPT